MYGMFVALGAAARHLTEDVIVAAVKEVSPSQVEWVMPHLEVGVALFVPTGRCQGSGLAWAPSRRVGVAVDGYLVTDSAAGPAGDVARLIQAVEEGDLPPALGTIVSGSFNLVVVDVGRGAVTIANDRLGSIPLYYAGIRDGCLVSTNPTLLLSHGLVAREIDATAWAEMACIGYTLGDRYFLKGIRLLPPASLLRWDLSGRICGLTSTALSPFERVPDSSAPELEAIAGAVVAACQRLARRGGRTAHLLSGGMDSRLILAAWPKDEPMTCYTYGHPALAEVSVARALAKRGGAAFVHVPLEGEAVAEVLEEMYLLNGPLIWPDRYLTARILYGHGFDHVLDGFLGDVFMGGTYHSPRGPLGRLGGRGPGRRFFEARVAEIGLDPLAESLFADIAEPGIEGFLAEYLNVETASMLTAQRTNILQDIVQELRRLRPADDSLALLVRNFKIANRGVHGILQQGATCRQFVQAYYPLTNDFLLLEILLKIPLHATAYRRLYIELFRRQFPAFAEVPYAASLLPLRRSVWAHWCSQALLGRGWRVPLVTGRLSGKRFQVDKWDAWLKASGPLREKAVTLLADSGLADREHLRAQMEKIAVGRETGSGDLFQLAGLGKLLGWRLTDDGRQMEKTA